MLRRTDLLYPELSYKITGIMFSVFNTLGFGYKEKYYQRALCEEFQRLGIKYREQIIIPVLFKEIIIGKQILDFLIEDKIILEIKRGNRFSQHDITQVISYLKSAKLHLAILARFCSKGVVFKRIINLR